MTNQIPFISCIEPATYLEKHLPGQNMRSCYLYPSGTFVRINGPHSSMMIRVSVPVTPAMP
jgi:hypothetical protein